MPKNKRPTEKQVEEALRVIRADYYSDVLGLAEDLVQMVRDGEVDSTESAQDRLHELVDGTQRVIYTYKAQQGLLASDNADAAFEEGLVDPGQFESDVPYGVLMYAAMERDVVERIDAGVQHDDWPDPFDDDTYEEDEE